ncbi:hypothetical protein A2U01_0101798, partial [Trifolium medium]|nr:hypothetical protein [Trifolium medium]
MEVVDKNLASIEEEYTAAKDKLSKDIEDPRTSQEEEITRLKKEYEDKLGKVKEDYAAA